MLIAEEQKGGILVYIKKKAKTKAQFTLEKHEDELRSLSNRLAAAVSVWNMTPPKDFVAESATWGRIKEYERSIASVLLFAKGAAEAERRRFLKPGEEDPVVAERAKRLAEREEAYRVYGKENGVIPISGFEDSNTLFTKMIARLNRSVDNEGKNRDTRLKNNETDRERRRQNRNLIDDPQDELVS